MSYNLGNSLSPMMFKSKKDKNKEEQPEGTRKERWRSKSVENIFDIKKPPPAASGKRGIFKKSPTPVRRAEDLPEWSELTRLKSIHPVVTCILPSLAMDFVASSLLAVGATPLVVEDPADMIKDLRNCKAVVVDVSAPQIIIEAFIEHYTAVCPNKPFVLVASDCGANDRKKELLLRALEHTPPTIISGRLGDICAVAQAIIEKNTSPFDSLSDSDDESPNGFNRPKVVLNQETKGEPDITAELPPVQRRMKFRKSRSPVSPQMNGDLPSPNLSSPPNQRFSPASSPRSSPISSPRGVRRFIHNRKKCSSSGLERITTGHLPRTLPPGQFTETQMNNVAVEDAMEYAQKLCSYSFSFVHLYETNMVTSGELVAEIHNTQLGMRGLHSTLPCSGAVIAAALACADNGSDGYQLKYCAHALALYYIAAEKAEGMAAAPNSEGLILPGSLRQHFIDALYSLHEPEVRKTALMHSHSVGMIKTS